MYRAIKNDLIDFINFGKKTFATKSLTHSLLQGNSNFYILCKFRVLNSLPSTHHDDILLRTRHFTAKDVQFLPSLCLFCPWICSLLQAMVEHKSYLLQNSTRKSLGL
jgi:hypothetical protein